MKPIDQQSGPELVATYNEAARQLNLTFVKRFATRSDAIRRVTELLKKLPDAETASGGTGVILEPAVDASLNTEVAVAEANALPAAEMPERAPEVAEGAEEQALADVGTAAGLAPVSEQRYTQADYQAHASRTAKDAAQPALRRNIRGVQLAPKERVFPRKEGTKQAVLVDILSRPQGATFGELYDAMAAAPGKPWGGSTIRSGLAWDMNHLAGYGISSEAFNGEEFAKQGRTYEAERLGWRDGPAEGYDPNVKLLVYRLTYPAGMTAPVPHTPRAKKD